MIQAAPVVIALPLVVFELLSEVLMDERVSLLHICFSERACFQGLAASSSFGANS